MNAMTAFQKRGTTIGYALVAVGLLSFGCNGTTGGGGGGFLGFDAGDTGPVSGLDVAAGEDIAVSDTGGTDATSGQDVFVAPKDNPQENALYTGLGLPPFGAAGTFNDLATKGTWIVNFSNWAQHQQAKVTLGAQAARIDFNPTVAPGWEAGCSLKTTESIYLEIASSGDVGFGWSQDLVEATGCASEKSSQSVKFMFAMRRVSWSAGQFGGLAGDWDIFGPGTHQPASLGCRIHVGDQGLQGCLDQIQWKVQATAAGDQISGSFNMLGNVEFTAQHTDNAGVPAGFGLAPTVPKPMDFGSYVGAWDVTFANWSGETTGSADVAGRAAKVALAGGASKCGVGARTYIGELSGSGELGAVWLEHVPATGCAGKPEIELVRILRRTSASASGQFAPITGGLEARDTGVQSSDPFSTCALGIDGSGLHGCAGLVSATEANSTISGSWGGYADFTAFRKGSGPVCGNGKCETGETTASCALDCPAGPTCGNGKCDAGETNATCSLDCLPTTNCGNGTCEAGENAANCVADCGTGCDGHCGTKSKTIAGVTCWCDEACVNSGDCCNDKVLYCAGAGCGDGTCNGSETSLTCGLDCPAAVGCTSSMTCASAEVCQNSNCTSASGLAYVFTINSITASTLDSTGSSWDVGGGAPDPYVVVKVDGVAKCTTTVKQDVFSGFWFTDCAPIILYSFNAVEVDVFDQDLTTDDFMDGSLWNDFTSILHAGTYNQALYGGLVSISFDVKAP